MYPDILFSYTHVCFYPIHTNTNVFFICIQVTHGRASLPVFRVWQVVHVLVRARQPHAHAHRREEILVSI